MNAKRVRKLWNLVFLFVLVVSLLLLGSATTVRAAEPVSPDDVWATFLYPGQQLRYSIEETDPFGGLYQLMYLTTAEDFGGSFAYFHIKRLNPWGVWVLVDEVKVYDGTPSSENPWRPRMVYFPNYRDRVNVSSTWGTKRLLRYHAFLPIIR